MNILSAVYWSVGPAYFHWRRDHGSIVVTYNDARVDISAKMYTRISAFVAGKDSK